MTRCSQCGQAVPSDDVLQFGEQIICGRCKPVYLQQVREGLGTQPESGPRYAGFWIRGAAVVIDELLYWTAEALVRVATGSTWRAAFGLEGDYAMVNEWSLQDWMMFLVWEVVSLAYFAGMVVRYGGTIGKLVLGLRVVTASGEPIHGTKAVCRHFAVYLSLLAFIVPLPDVIVLSLLPCLAGLVMAAFDSQKRALHDRLCGTRVIHRRRPPGEIR